MKSVSLTLLAIAWTLGLVGLEIASSFYSRMFNAVAKQEMSEHVASEVSIQIQTSIEALISPKLALKELVSSAVRTGLYAPPFDSENYFNLVGNTVVVENDILAMYQGSTERNTFKIHRQDEGYISMERRMFATQTKQSWRYLEAGTDATNRTFGPEATKTYDVWAKSWYVGAQGIQEKDYLLQGPVVEVYPGEGVFTYLEMIFGVNRKDGGFLAYKVEFFTNFLNNIVRNLKIGTNGRAYIIDRAGLVVALSKSEYQMTTDSEGNTIPRNIDSLAAIDEGIKIFLDEKMIESTGSTTISKASPSGVDLTIAKTPVTGLLVDWNIIIISVDSDNLVRSRGLYFILEALQYVIVAALCLSIAWELVGLFKGIMASRNGQSRRPITEVAPKDVEGK